MSALHQSQPGLTGYVFDIIMSVLGRATASALQRSQPRFNEDIFDIIMSMLGRDQDRTTLYSAALASPELLPSATKALYADVRINDQVKFLNFCRTIFRFQDIGCLVRSFTFRPTAMDLNAWPGEQPQISSARLSDYFMRLLSLLPHLRALSVYPHCETMVPPDCTIFQNANLIPQLHSLRLDSVTIRSSQFLSQLPPLQAITLDTPHRWLEQTFPVAIPSGALNAMLVNSSDILHHLALELDYVALMLLEVRGICFPSLRSFVTTGFSVQWDTPEVQDLFVSAFPQLEHMSFANTTANPLSLLSDVRALRHLRALAFRLEEALEVPPFSCPSLSSRAVEKLHVVSHTLIGTNKLKSLRDWLQIFDWRCLTSLSCDPLLAIEDLLETFRMSPVLQFLRLRISHEHEGAFSMQQLDHCLCTFFGRPIFAPKLRCLLLDIGADFNEPFTDVEELICERLAAGDLDAFPCLEMIQLSLMGEIRAWNLIFKPGVISLDEVLTQEANRFRRQFEMRTWELIE